LRKNSGKGKPTHIRHIMRDGFWQIQSQTRAHLNAKCFGSLLVRENMQLLVLQHSHIHDCWCLCIYDSL
jgi:hypothetical protein